MSGPYFKYMLNFVGKSQTVFQSGCIILCFTQQRVSISAALHPFKHLVRSVFFNFSHANSCAVDLIVLLICIFLINNHV